MKTHQASDLYQLLALRKHSLPLFLHPSFRDSKFQLGWGVDASDRWARLALQCHQSAFFVRTEDLGFSPREVSLQSGSDLPAASWVDAHRPFVPAATLLTLLCSGPFSKWITAESADTKLL